MTLTQVNCQCYQNLRPNNLHDNKLLLIFAKIFQSSLIFLSKAGAHSREHLTNACVKGWLVALSTILDLTRKALVYLASSSLKKKKFYNIDTVA